MTPEDWALVARLYQASLERGATERASFLSNACGGNELLLREVESLLEAEQEAEQEADDFLEADAAKGRAELSVAESPSLAGKTLHHYELLSRLGSGGMGEVYRARDKSLRREAAIKILPPALATDADRLRRFEQEARAASALNHPNIVTIYETGDTDYGRFLAMELVQGETLRSVIRLRPPLDRVILICTQVAQALKAAHAANIVHRDIKPENLMLRDDGYVKVLDFGLARLMPPRPGLTTTARGGGSAGELQPAITEPGMVIGTIRYMSPEQAQGKQVTGASDIFSFGLVTYELATGQHPFPAETEFGTLDAILSQAALPPSRINAAIPAAWEQLVLWMLDKQAASRPSAAEVEQALAEIASTSNPGTNATLFRTSKHAVGRALEQEQLNAFWDTAAAAHGLLCCVSGEPAIGKTTFVGAFFQTSQRMAVFPR